MKKIFLLILLISNVAILKAQKYNYYTDNNTKKSGLKDENGKIVIPAKYSFVSSIVTEGIAWGSIAEKIGFIAIGGKEITPMKYDNVYSFSNGFAKVNIGAYYSDDGEFGDDMIGGKWGFVNRLGKEITALKYEYVTDFYKEGFAIVYMGEKGGLINTTGKEITPMKYNNIRVCSKEPTIAVVNIGGKYDEIFGELSFNSFVGGKQGFINCLTGKEIGTVQFSNAGDFSEGLAIVCLGSIYNGEGYEGGNWGYMDKTGKIVIPIKYEEAGYFFEGKAKVKLNGKTFYINKSGNEIK